jgi:biotin carboxylase
VHKQEAVVLADPEGLLLRENLADRGYKVICLFTMSKDVWMNVYNVENIQNLTLNEIEELYDLVIFESDIDKIIKMLKESDFSIKAIIPASEVGVNVADIIADHFNLPCNDPLLISARRDKSVMKEKAREAGLRCADFARCLKPEDIEEFMLAHNYPVVIKTPAGTGSHYVFVCENKGDLIEKFWTITRNRDAFGVKTNYALIEELIGGTEYIVDLFGDGKNIHVTDIWKYEKIDSRFASNLYYNMILEQPENSQLNDLKNYAIKLAKAVGIKIGPIHAEIKLDEHGPIMIEVASRFCGARVPHFLKQFSNYDPISLTVDVYLGNNAKLNLPVKFDKSIIIAECPTELHGVVTGLHGTERIKSLNSYHSHSLALSIGDIVRPSTDFMSIPLIVWLVHENKEVLYKEAEIVHKSFKIDIGV